MLAAEDARAASHALDTERGRVTALEAEFAQLREAARSERGTSDGMSDGLALLRAQFDNLRTTLAINASVVEDLGASPYGVLMGREPRTALGEGWAQVEFIEFEVEFIEFDVEFIEFRIMSSFDVKS